MSDKDIDHGAMLRLALSRADSPEAVDAYMHVRQCDDCGKRLHGLLGIFETVLDEAPKETAFRVKPLVSRMIAAIDGRREAIIGLREGFQAAVASLASSGGLSAGPVSATLAAGAVLARAADGHPRSSVRVDFPGELVWLEVSPLEELSPGTPPVEDKVRLALRVLLPDSSREEEAVGVADATVALFSGVSRWEAVKTDREGRTSIAVSRSEAEQLWKAIQGERVRWQISLPLAPGQVAQAIITRLARLESLTGPASTAPDLLTEGVSQMIAQNWSKALETLEEAERMFQQDAEFRATQNQDPSRSQEGAAQSALSLGNTLMHEHQASPALEAFDRARKGFERVHDVVGAAEAKLGQGYALQDLDEGELALDSFVRAAREFASEARVDRAAESSLHAGVQLHELKRHEDAFNWLTRAEEDFVAAGQQVDAARSQRAIGEILLGMGRAGEALERFLSAYGIFDEVDEPIEHARCDRDVGLALLALERPADALSALQRAREQYAELNREDAVAEIDSWIRETDRAEGARSSVTSSVQIEPPENTL